MIKWKKLFLFEVKFSQNVHKIVFRKFCCSRNPEILVFLFRLFSLAVLPWFSCPGYPVPVVLVLANLSSLSCPAGLSDWPVQTGLFQLSCPGCPVMAVLSWLSCHGCPPTVVLSQLPCPCCHLLAILSWLFYPVSPLLLSCPGGPVLVFLSPCPVLSLTSSPSGPVPSILLLLSCPRSPR
jgi:hypothetical protein